MHVFSIPSKDKVQAEEGTTVRLQTLEIRVRLAGILLWSACPVSASMKPPKTAWSAGPSCRNG